MSKFAWEEEEIETGGITYTPPEESPPPMTPAQKATMEQVRELDAMRAKVGSVLAAAGEDIADARPSTLYVYRQVLNGRDIVKWAKAQGFTDLARFDDLHVTIVYSRSPVDWMAMGEPWEHRLTIPAGGPRVVSDFNGHWVLEFASNSLQHRHLEMREKGASHDWPSYRPHITFSTGEYEGKCKPYTGPIILGPEVFEELVDDY